jgi:hypothetical protein
LAAVGTLGDCQGGNSGFSGEHAAEWSCLGAGDWQGTGRDLLNRHYPNLYHQVFYLLALFVASETYRLILESRSFGHQSSEMIGK